MNTAATPADNAVELELGPPGERGELGLATSHYLDVVRANARRRLDSGEHPDDVMLTVLDAVLDWLIARNHPHYETLGQTAAFIINVEQEVRSLIGAEATSPWFVCPNPMLGGRSPVEALVSHRFADITLAVRRLRPKRTPAQQAAENEAKAQAALRDIDREKADREQDTKDEVAESRELDEIRAAAQALGLDLDELYGDAVKKDPEAEAGDARDTIADTGEPVEEEPEAGA